MKLIDLLGKTESEAELHRAGDVYYEGSAERHLMLVHRDEDYLLVDLNTGETNEYALESDPEDCLANVKGDDLVYLGNVND